MIQNGQWVKNNPKCFWGVELACKNYIDYSVFWGWFSLTVYVWWYKVETEPGNFILDLTNYWNQCFNLLVETFSCLILYLKFFFIMFYIIYVVLQCM